MFVYSPLLQSSVCLLLVVCVMSSRAQRAAYPLCLAPTASWSKVRVRESVCECEPSLAIVTEKVAKLSMLQHEQPLRLAWKPGSGCLAQVVRCFSDTLRQMQSEVLAGAGAVSSSWPRYYA